MNFIKEHKIIAAIMIVIIIFVVIILFLFTLKSFSVDLSKNEYGDRLKGIEKVMIDDKTENKIKEEMKKKDEIESASCRQQGRLLYVTLRVKEEVTLDASKQLANSVLEHLNDAQKKYYDIQILIENKNDKAEGYPKIGYKHKTSSEFVW